MRINLFGSLARVTSIHDRWLRKPCGLADELSFPWPLRDSFTVGIARGGLEIVHCFSEALTILKEYPSTRVRRA